MGVQRPGRAGPDAHVARTQLKFSPDKVRCGLLQPQGAAPAGVAGLARCIPVQQMHESCAMQVDTMIVQAIGLLDDLDKELNTYSMRVREWYGWHFPEMSKIVTDNVMYAKTVSHSALLSSSCHSHLHLLSLAQACPPVP